MRMTTAQRETASALRDAGLSRRDANIYARKTSDFMFQTGVAYTSGILIAGTIGAAKLVGHGIGWAVGETAHCVGGLISDCRGAKKHRKQMSSMVSHAKQFAEEVGETWSEEELQEEEATAVEGDELCEEPKQPEPKKKGGKK